MSDRAATFWTSWPSYTIAGVGFLIWGLAKLLTRPDGWDTAMGALFLLVAIVNIAQAVRAYRRRSVG